VSLKWKVAWELGAEKFLPIRYLQDCRRRREAVEEEVFLIIYGNSYTGGYVFLNIVSLLPIPCSIVTHHIDL
jgi:hypothetical protein